MFYVCGDAPIGLRYLRWGRVDHIPEVRKMIRRVKLLGMCAESPASGGRFVGRLFPPRRTRTFTLQVFPYPAKYVYFTASSTPVTLYFLQSPLSGCDLPFRHRQRTAAQRFALPALCGQVTFGFHDIRQAQNASLQRVGFTRC